MIDIQCLSRPEHGVYALHIRGHAQYAPHGADIVCAGVSALGYTFAAAVQRMDAEGMLACRPHIRQAEGELCVFARAEETYSAALAQSFETVKTGLRLLAESYPAHVRLR